MLATYLPQIFSHFHKLTVYKMIGTMSRTVGISLSLDSLIGVISYSVRFNARKMILYVSTLLHLSNLEMFKPF